VDYVFVAGTQDADERSALYQTLFRGVFESMAEFETVLEACTPGPGHYLVLDATAAAHAPDRAVAAPSSAPVRDPVVLSRWHSCIFWYCQPSAAAWAVTGRRQQVECVLPAADAGVLATEDTAVVGPVPLSSGGAEGAAANPNHGDGSDGCNASEETAVRQGRAAATETRANDGQDGPVPMARPPMPMSAAGDGALDADVAARLGGERTLLRKGLRAILLLGELQRLTALVAALNPGSGLGPLSDALRASLLEILQDPPAADDAHV
jgi:hypothetical protein